MFNLKMKPVQKSDIVVPFKPVPKPDRYVAKEPVPKPDKKEKYMEWTKEQKQAMYEKGENILVAAAARKWKDSCTGRKNYK